MVTDSEYVETKIMADKPCDTSGIANGKDTQFQGVTLNGAIFDDVKMPRVLFDGAGMTDVSMVRAYMPEASLMWANVIDSDLRNANLQ